MLKSLYVKNYALIREMRFEPAEGMNVITGETGAGKSIMLGALGLVLGNRADSSVLMLQNEKCLIEAIFNTRNKSVLNWISEHDLDQLDEIILRREISASGKSRAFINDTPVNLSDLKDLGDQLIQIHTQNTSLMLKESGAQLELLDSFAGNTQLLDEFQENYRKAADTRRELDLIKQQIQAANREKEFVQFQFEEIYALSILPNEEEQLEEKLSKLTHAGDIAESVYRAQNSLTESEQSAYSAIHAARTALKNVSAYDRNCLELSNKLDALAAEIKDLGSHLADMASDTETDPEQLEMLNARVSQIQTLKRKHQVNHSDELINLMNQFQQTLLLATEANDKLEGLEAKLQTEEQACMASAMALHRKRAEHTDKFATSTISMLKDLGMPHADLKIECHWHPDKLTFSGGDRIEIMFSSHGTATLPLEKVASGGEVSRLNFCFKSLVAGKKDLPAVVFDEADTGISGEVALKMGNYMRLLGKNLQVITITHLPQVAAAASTHFMVKKLKTNDTVSTVVVKLNPDDREMQIAEMLGGAEPGDAAKANARELLSH